MTNSRGRQSRWAMLPPASQSSQSASGEFRLSHLVEEATAGKNDGRQASGGQKTQPDAASVQTHRDERTLTGARRIEVESDSPLPFTEHPDDPSSEQNALGHPATRLESTQNDELIKPSLDTLGDALRASEVSPLARETVELDARVELRTGVATLPNEIFEAEDSERPTAIDNLLQANNSSPEEKGRGR
ncbi:MAG: hypothetical protein MK135_16900 [Polyangiaceae bacterium]|nr:hypothetical protein [Polyangiaceae bacterium]